MPDALPQRQQTRRCSQRATGARHAGRGPPTPRAAPRRLGLSAGPRPPPRRSGAGRARPVPDGLALLPAVWGRHAPPRFCEAPSPQPPGTDAVAAPGWLLATAPRRWAGPVAGRSVHGRCGMEGRSLGGGPWRSSRRSGGPSPREPCHRGAPGPRAGGGSLAPGRCSGNGPVAPSGRAPQGPHGLARGHSRRVGPLGPPQPGRP